MIAQRALSVLIVAVAVAVAYHHQPQLFANGQLLMTSTTQSADASIRWSFGGWAPLDERPASALNASRAGVGAGAAHPPPPHPQQMLPLGSQLAPQHKLELQMHQQQYRQQAQAPISQNQQHQRKQPHQNEHQTSQQQRPSMTYSPRAPAPIIRAHLLPRARPSRFFANNHRHNHNNQQPHRLPPRPHLPSQRRPQPPYTSAHATRAFHDMQLSMMAAQHARRQPHLLHSHQMRQQQYPGQNQNQNQPQLRLVQQQDQMPLIEASARPANGSQQVAAGSYQSRQPQQAANIQDVKQQLAGGSAAVADSASQPNDARTHHHNQQQFLTIPVAVETEGDKVLTSDDIREIEKHVIDVLPSLRAHDASKAVRLADAQLAVARLQDSAGGASGLIQTHKSAATQPHSELHSTANSSTTREPYSGQLDEHRATIKALEADAHRTTAGPLRQTTQYQTLNMNRQQQQPLYQQSPDEHPNALSLAEQYFVAGAPSELDGEQMHELGVALKQDLLSNIRDYEPTRAQPHQSQHSTTQSFGTNRFSGGRSQQTTQAPTRVTLAGRKVSDVMRPLIRTTPVPMTTPLHVPALEPEKLDAIQLIAGRANDKQPIVVEAHHLVSHSPVDGFDFNSIGSVQQQQPQLQNHSDYNQQQYQNHQQQPQQATTVYEEQPQTTQQQQQHQQQHQHNEQSQHQHQNQHNEQSQHQQNDNQGAVIEYVAVADPAAVVQQFADDHRRPSDDSSPADVAQFVYDLAGATGGGGSKKNDGGQYQSSQPDQQTATTPMVPQTTSGGDGKDYQPLSAGAWSASVASEHQQQQQQQQQVEINDQPAALLALDMPATAGYNFFQPQQQHYQQDTGAPPPQPPPTTKTRGGDDAENDVSNKQQQQRGKWRTKAGGSLPNPDAQYDGQIVKAKDDVGGEDEGDERRTTRPDDQYANNDATSSFKYSDEPRQTTLHFDPGQQQGQADYQRTSSFVGGAQMHHQSTPTDYLQQQQRDQNEYSSASPVKTTLPSHLIGYVPVDRDQAQEHLAQHQAEHQAHRAKIMANHNQQQYQQQQQQQQQTDANQYQTTTPLSLLSTIEAISGNNNENRQQQQQQLNGNKQSYSPDESENQNQSSDAMLVNENPIQVPISDQQSLIPDHSGGERDYGAGIANDDNQSPNQRHEPAVYSVYQAYYAPKDHKPLPGYVRLTLAEFQDLFRDAEIHYVDQQQQNTANGQLQPNHSTPLSKYTDQDDRSDTYQNDNKKQDQHQHANGPELRLDGDQFYTQDLKAAASDRTKETIVVDSRLMDTKKSAKLRRNLSTGTRKVIAISRNARHLFKSRLTGASNSNTKSTNANNNNKITNKSTSKSINSIGKLKAY